MCENFEGEGGSYNPVMPWPAEYAHAFFTPMRPGFPGFIGRFEGGIRFQCIIQTVTLSEYENNALAGFES
jgi:hypothetical protein